MDREKLRTLPLGHAWTPQTLQQHFAAVVGGVAYPGRRPGHAIVVGLCHPRDRDDFEAHVLDESESEDLGALLRACRALGKRYRPAGMGLYDLFRWIGDGKHVGAREIVYRLNGEPGNEYNRLSIGSTTMLDDPTPYLSIFALLSDLTRPETKRLYLHGSQVQLAMHEIPRDEVAETKLGTAPGIEALGFVIQGLREEAAMIWHRMVHPHDDDEVVNW
ncbi:MAG: hypothetical protein GXX98_01565 [Planctomycetes bacterium]|nr:hypothetical protein [Planctomycetota bacterium]